MAQGITRDPSEVLSSVQPSPGTKELAKQWESLSPQEKARACRKVLYGVVSPALHEQTGDDVAEQVEALFEATFSSIEQLSMQQSRRGSSSS